MDMSLIYIAAVIVVVAIGFVFALRMGIVASLSADREWPAISKAAQEVKQEAQPEPSAVSSASTH